MLNIDKKEENGKLTIKLEGRLDTTTAPMLEECIKESIDNINALEIDFTGLEYISSAGLRVLLTSQKTMNKKGEMTVLHPSDTIMEIFEVTGFMDILNIVQ